MGYGLGVDLGTTHTAAALDLGGRVEAVTLGSRRAEFPSVLYLRTDGTVLVGEAAQRRGDADPARLARECKRRIGDPVPIMLGGTPFSAHALTARLLHHVVETVTRAQDAAPEQIVITHPANWGPYKRELLLQAADLADLPTVTLRPEPEAAAVRFASTARVAAGEVIAVYDLGGGTFDAAVLRKSAQGFTVLGEPGGIEQLGGVDFDEAILEHVRAVLGDTLAGLDTDDEEVRPALARLRRDCVEAKESLSVDTEAVIAVALPRLHTRVRITRAEFESMIRPALEETIAAMHRAVRSAGITPAELRCIVLTGGSSRIPLVTELLCHAFARPVVPDEQPELGIAMGAALLSGRPADVTPPLPSADPATSAPSPRPASLWTPDQTAVPPAPRPAEAPSPLVAAGRRMQAPRPAGAAPVGRAAVPPPARRPGGTARRRLRAYRWPLIGCLIAAALGVTAATAWSRSSDGDADPPATTTPGRPPVTALWQVPTGHPATGPVAVAAQHIVLAGADGTLRGLRRADGRADWTREAGAGVSVATRIQDGVAYATTAGGDLLAVDAATGEVQWRRKTGGRFSDRPFVARPRVYAGGLDSVLYAYELGGDHRRWRVWTGGEIRHRPVVVGKIAVVAGRDGRLYGVNDAGGWVWQRSVGQVEHPPAAGGDAVCVAVTDGSVTCLRATDGRRPVRISLPGTALSVLNCGEGVVYAAAADRTVGAWDTRTGALRWRYRPGVTGPAAADLVVHDGQVQVAYPDGRLAGIDAATGRERWHHTVNDTFDSAPKGDGQALFVVGRTGTAYALAVPSSPTPSATSPAATPPTSATTTEPTATPAPYKRRTQRPQRSSPPTSPTTPSSEATTGSPSPDQTTPTAPDQERRQSPQREPETHSVISSPASRSHPRSAVVNIVS